MAIAFDGVIDAELLRMIIVESRDEEKRAKYLQRGKNENESLIDENYNKFGDE